MLMPVNKNLCRLVLMVISALLVIVVATVTAEIGPLPPINIIQDHPQEFSYLFALVFAFGVLGQGFWLGRLIKNNDTEHTSMIDQIEKNRKEAKEESTLQWNELSRMAVERANIVGEFRTLQGEHNVMIQSGCHRRVEDPADVVAHHTRHTNMPNPSGGKDAPGNP